MQRKAVAGLASVVALAAGLAAAAQKAEGVTADQSVQPVGSRLEALRSELCALRRVSGSRDRLGRGTSGAVGRAIRHSYR